MSVCLFGRGVESLSLLLPACLRRCRFRAADKAAALEAGGGGGFRSGDPNVQNGVVCEFDLGLTTPTRSRTVSPTQPSRSHTPSPTVSPSPSPSCAPGWTFYDDAAAPQYDREGHNSCVYLTVQPATPAVNWAGGNTQCASLHAGATLLTISSTNATAATSGLFNTVLTLAKGGCCGGGSVVESGLCRLELLLWCRGCSTVTTGMWMFTPGMWVFSP